MFKITKNSASTQKDSFSGTVDARPKWKAPTLLESVVRGVCTPQHEGDL
jgi:hypothetical protein